MARASIQTDLSLDTTAFQRGLAQSQKGIKNFVSNGIKQFGALAGAAGLGAMAGSAFRLAADITNLSKVANTSVEEFQKFAFAAKTVGVEQDKLSDILKDVSDKVGDFLQTGGGPMADFFENIAPKVGVTAEQFRNLSGKDALQLYVSSLQKANISQNEMTFFMEAIASDATLLLPLLKDNGQALSKLGAEAQRLGLVMDQDVVDKLNAASIEINKFKTSATILTGTVLSKVVPAFSIFSNGLGTVGDIAGSLISKFASFLGFIGRSVGATIDPVVKQFESLAAGLKGVALSFKEPKKAAEEFKRALELQKESAQALVSIPDKIAAEYKRANEEMELASKSLDRSMMERADNIEKAWSDMWGKNVETAKNATKKIKSEITSGAGGDDDKPNTVEDLKKKLTKLEMERIRAQASGDAAAEASLARRVKMAKEILRLMGMGFSQEEATKLSQGILDEKSQGESDTALTGGKSVSEAMEDAKKRGIRFQKFVGAGGEQYYQRFINGSMAGKFTAEQLKSAAEKQPGKADQSAKQTSLLESIDREIRKNP